jgi:hypothetical protein
MKLEKQTSWIGNSDFKIANPISVIITAVELAESFGKKDTQLYMKLGTEIKRMSLYGVNLNTLITKFGAETDTWINQAIRIEQVLALDGKTKKIII